MERIDANTIRISKYEDLDIRDIKVRLQTLQTDKRRLQELLDDVHVQIDALKALIDEAKSLGVE